MSEKTLKMKQELDEERSFKHAIKLFKRLTVHIEVLIDGKIERIYFQKLPYCFNLKKDIKDEFSSNVVRTSTKQKVKHLFKDTKKIINIMKYEEALKQVFYKY